MSRFTAHTRLRPGDSYGAPFPARRARGFTLIELLVVLVIIGIGISTVVVALSPDTRGMAREEGDRLALLLNLASEESMQGGMAMAWVGREDGYEFVARELTDMGPEWMTVRGDELLHPRELRNGAAIRGIEVDGKALPLGERVELGDRGVQSLSVEIALGDTRARVSRVNSRFESALLPGDGT